MATRYEVVMDQDDMFLFQLRTADGEVILRSLGSPSKIMTQNEILHVRNALRDESRMVQHTAHGLHFVVIKDRDDAVLARSMKVDSDEALTELIASLLAAAQAPIIDLSKAPRSHAS